MPIDDFHRNNMLCLLAKRKINEIKIICFNEFIVIRYMLVLMNLNSNNLTLTVVNDQNAFGGFVLRSLDAVEQIRTIRYVLHYYFLYLCQNKEG